MAPRNGTIPLQPLAWLAAHIHGILRPACKIRNELTSFLEAGNQTILFFSKA